MEKVTYSTKVLFVKNSSLKCAGTCEKLTFAQMRMETKKHDVTYVTQWEK